MVGVSEVDAEWLFLGYMMLKVFKVFTFLVSLLKLLSVSVCIFPFSHPLMSYHHHNESLRLLQQNRRIPLDQELAIPRHLQRQPIRHLPTPRLRLLRQSPPDQAVVASSALPRALQRPHQRHASGHSLRHARRRLLPALQRRHRQTHAPHPDPGPHPARPRARLRRRGLRRLHGGQHVHGAADLPGLRARDHHPAERPDVDGGVPAVAGLLGADVDGELGDFHGPRAQDGVSEEYGVGEPDRAGGVGAGVGNSYPERRADGVEWGVVVLGGIGDVWDSDLV